MTTEIIELGTISSRGQIAIPATIRKELNLQEGDKLLFLAAGDTLVIKKAEAKTFLEITEPLWKTKKKIKEEDVVDLIHKMRK